VDRIRVRLASTASCLVAAATAVLLAAAAPAAATSAAAAPAAAARAGAAPVAAAQAGAANLGTVRLSSTSGSVDTTPIFASAVTSAPCPAGYGTDAQLRVGQPGGPYTNLAKPLTAGGYDKAAVSARPNRSFTTALGGVRPADGEWWVVVECFSITLGIHPQRFVTEITVSGPRWRVGRPAGSAQAGGTGQGQGGTTAAPGTGTVDPTRTPGPQSANAGSAPDGAEHASTAPGDPRLAANSDSGSASFGGVVAMLAVAGVLLVIGVVYLVTRRRSPTSVTNAKTNTPKANAKTPKTNAKTKTRV
jgi:hypothetical protein